MRKFTYLHLTGGLGNQLFQMAAGMYFSDCGELIISEKNGKPRVNSSNKPELLSFKLPINISILKSSRFSNLNSRVCGYILRMSVKPGLLGRLAISRIFIGFCASIISTFYFKKLVMIAEVKGVGFAGYRNRCNFLIGYFQTHKYAENPEVFSKLQSLTLENPGPATRALVEEAKDQKPLVVHLRRGDYSQEPSFGLIGFDYYFRAIEVILQEASCKSIWIFSDDVSEAERMFKNQFNLTIKFIGDVDNSASASLEVMRHGKGFVIGNSSFSWWSAFLRHDQGATVIAPDPWFKGQEEPKFLIPSSWIRLNGDHFTGSRLQLESE